MVKQEKTLSTGELFLKLWWLKSITNNIKTAYIHWKCNFDLLFQLWYNTYIIYHFNYFKCTEGSSTFTLLCSVHHCASPELLILKDETLDSFEDWKKKKTPQSWELQFIWRYYQGLWPRAPQTALRDCPKEVRDELGYTGIFENAWNKQIKKTHNQTPNMQITSDMQMTPPLWQKLKGSQRASWWKWKRRVKKLA